MKNILFRLIMSGFFVFVSQSLEAMELDHPHDKKQTHAQLIKDVNAECVQGIGPELEFTERLWPKLLEKHGVTDPHPKDRLFIVEAIMTEYRATVDNSLEGHLFGAVGRLLKDLCDQMDPYAPTLVFFIKHRCERENINYFYDQLRSIPYDFSSDDKLFFLLPMDLVHARIETILRGLHPYADKLSDDELYLLPRYFLMASYVAFKFGKYGFAIDAAKAQKYAIALKDNRDEIGVLERKMRRVHYKYMQKIRAKIESNIGEAGA